MTGASEAIEEEHVHEGRVRQAEGSREGKARRDVLVVSHDEQRPLPGVAERPAGP